MQSRSYFQQQVVQCKKNRHSHTQRGREREAASENPPCTAAPRTPHSGHGESCKRCGRENTVTAGSLRVAAGAAPPAHRTALPGRSDFAACAVGSAQCVVEFSGWQRDCRLKALGCNYNQLPLRLSLFIISISFNSRTKAIMSDVETKVVIPSVQVCPIFRNIEQLDEKSENLYVKI